MPEFVISPEEYRGRLESVREIMRENSLGVMLLDAQENVSYLSGYTPPSTFYQALVVPLSADPVLVLRANDRSRAGRASWIERLVAYRDWEDPFGAVAGVLDEGGSGAIGSDMSSMTKTVARFRELRLRLGERDWTDVSPDLDRLRSRKSASELALHRRAAAVADEAATEGIEAMLRGVTPAVAGLAASRLAIDLGADDRRCVIARREPYREDDGAPTAMIELVPAIRGYDARLIRTVALDEPSPAQLATAARVLEIQGAQIAAMLPGARASDVDALCRRPILGEGLRATYEGLSGHGIGFSTPGRTTDASLAFVPGASWVLEPGMVFHMYTRAQGFVVGDTVLVDDTGPQRLTCIERKLYGS